MLIIDKEYGVRSCLIEIMDLIYEYLYKVSRLKALSYVNLLTNIFLNFLLRRLH